jgi:hypothetical protein
MGTRNPQHNRNIQTWTNKIAQWSRNTCLCGLFHFYK